MSVFVYEVPTIRHLAGHAWCRTVGISSLHDGRAHPELPTHPKRQHTHHSYAAHTRTLIKESRRPAGVLTGDLGGSVAYPNMAHVLARRVPKRGETEEGETACLVLSYEGERMQQSLYIAGIDFR